MEGIDFFEAYVPVVQCTTVRLMFIFEVLLGLKSKKGNVNYAFLHADIPENERVYAKIPIRFEKFPKNGPEKYLKLKNYICGLCQS